MRDSLRVGPVGGEGRVSTPWLRGSPLFTDAEPPTERPDLMPCPVFMWIGQTFESCEACGRPEREHLYHPAYGGSRPLFRVKTRSYNGRWRWQWVGSFVKGEAR